MKTASKAAIAFAMIIAIAVPSYLTIHYIKIANAGAPTLSYTQLADAMVRRDAGLPITGPLDPLKASLAVRDYVYRSYINKPQKFDSDDQLYTSLTTSGGSMYCGGASLAYAWALKKIGIPSRFIQLGGDGFFSGIDVYNTHVTVEAFIDGAWQISDPTFNVSVSCSSNPAKPIATPEAMACVKKGNLLILTPGKTQIPGKVGDGYKMITPREYGEYFSAYTRQAVSFSGVSEPEDTFPTPDWIQTGLTLNADCGVQLGLPLECGLTHPFHGG